MLRTQMTPLIFPIVSFLVPFGIRLIPELFLPYPIGFDTIAYYIPIMIARIAFTASPIDYLGGTILLYLPLTVIYSVIGNASLVMKVVPAVLLGLLGISAYFVGKDFLGWRPVNAAFLAVLLCSYFVTLRLSWDLQKNVLGLSFALMTLALVDHADFKFRYVLLPASSALAVMTHESSAVLVALIAVASLSLKKRYLELKNYAPFVPAALLLILQVYLRRNLFSLQIQQPIGAGQSNFAYNLGFLLIAFWPLLPLAIVGAIRQVNRHFSIWIIVCLIFGLFLPYTGLPTGASYRWILILVPPMVVLFIQGAAFASSVKPHWGRALGRIAIASFLLVIIALSSGYLSLNGLSRGYFDYAPQYKALMPVTMVESTIAIRDVPSIISIADWANSTLANSSVLILPFQLYGWYLTVVSGRQGLNYRPTGQIGNIDDTLASIQPKTGPIALYARNVDLYTPGDEVKLTALAFTTLGYERVYVVWWTYGSSVYNLPSSFSIAYTAGNLSIFALSRS